MGWFDKVWDVASLGVKPALEAGLGYLTGANAAKHAQRAADVAYDRTLFMSNSAHQREVADLRAAGLNPVLSALGGGASSMVAPVANTGSSWMSDMSEGAKNRLAQNVYAKSRKEVEVLDSTIAKQAAEANLAKTASARELVQADNLAAQTDKARADAAMARANTARTCLARIIWSKRSRLVERVTVNRKKPSRVVRMRI